MSDFVQTMKDWRRMCKDRSCDRCNLKGSCDIDPDSWTDADILKIETNVEIWAEKHPEPVYPTWATYLKTLGFPGGITIPLDCDLRGCEPIERFAWLAENHIPADIAQKLRVEPEEM